MEIELKYSIPDDETADKIWENRLFSDMEEEGSREELDLLAKYYDTADRALAKNRIAYRVRKEGDHFISTVKWQGKAEDGLHSRKELACPVPDEEPDIGIFAESDIGEELAAVVDDKPLQILLETEVRRRRFRIDTGTAILEVSVDQGRVKTACGEDGISEVEIELFTGDTEELVRIGKKLQKLYGLRPEDTSKYIRGIRLLDVEEECAAQSADRMRQ